MRHPLLLLQSSDGAELIARKNGLSVAALLAFAANKLKQPLLLAYLRLFRLPNVFTAIGDVAMASFADRLVNLGMEFLWETRPAAGDWARRLLARPGVQAACPPAGERLPAPAADTLAELRRRLG